MRRSVGLAQGFGAQHIKTRTFRRWDINARMIADAHRRGMRATGHCATQLPLIAAGMDAKEHLAFCSTRGAGDPYALNEVMLYDDQIQLLRAAGVSVVPTIVYMSLGVAVNENPKVLDQTVSDVMDAPFPVVEAAHAAESIVKLLSKSSPAVLVQEHGQIQGIVTRSDMLSFMMAR